MIGQQKNNRILYHQSESEVTQSCLTLCNPMDCSLPGSSVYGIFQAKVLEWVDISSSKGSSRSKQCVKVYVGCHNKFPQTWWLKITEIYPLMVLEFVSLQSKCVNRNMIPLKLLGENSSLPLPASNGSWHPLASLTQAVSLQSLCLSDCLLCVCVFPVSL